VEGFYPKDRGELGEPDGARVGREGLRIFGFLFLFEVEGEEEKDDADRLKGCLLHKALEKSGLQVIIFGDDLNAVDADDFSQFGLDVGCKIVITHIHIQFYAGIGADAVDVI